MQGGKFLFPFGKGCVGRIQCRLLFIQLCLLGGHGSGLLIQRGLLDSQLVFLLLQLVGLGFQHGEVLIQADANDQHEHQQ